MFITSRLHPLLLRVAGLSLIATAFAACGVTKQSAPSLLSPSEFGVSVTAVATPDILPRDGSTKSDVKVTVRDDQGRPKAGQQLALSLCACPGVSLSPNSIVTASDGTASFSVTAPPASAVGPNQITVGITPLGGNFDNSSMRTVSIALTGLSNTTVPTPAFTVTPAAPEVRQVTTFNASTTTDEGGPCLSACTYSWDFDDGGAASGVTAVHAFNTARSYNVALTVTDAVGSTATLRQLVNVTAPAAPTVTLAVAPNPPVLSQLATFTATATPAVNHSVALYEWNFGDGTTQTTSTSSVTKTYTTPGSYVATVRATDDLGQTGGASVSFTLGTGIAFPSPAFSMSPSNPHVGDTVNFNATGVTTSNGATITAYDWDFGDGTTGTGVSTTHAFANARTFVVRLTVTDSQGRTASTTINLPVA